MGKDYHNRDLSKTGENRRRFSLTGIRNSYTLAGTNEVFDEVDDLMVRHFLNTLAEVSLSIAARMDGKQSQ